MATLYAGPGKFYSGTTVLWPEGENGGIQVAVQQEALDISTGFYGRQAAQGGDSTAKISLTPFDNWGALGFLYPAFVKTPAPGTRAHGAADVPGVIWTPDGRLYSFPRIAVTKHPDLHLGIGKALFGQCEITAILAAAKAQGDAGALYTITESAGADPGGQMTMTDFIRERWTGVWGTAEGFGGGSGDTPIEAEDEWTISFDVKYSPLKVQGLTRAMKLDSVAVMAKVRPYGPTHTEIDAAIGINSGRLLGQRFAGAASLVLTSTSAKTITFAKADPVGAGFEFGGTRLGTGEVGFVTAMNWTAGVTQPLIAFSA